MSEDFPTFERPTSATCGLSSSGRSSRRVKLFTKVADGFGFGIGIGGVNA